MANCTCNEPYPDLNSEGSTANCTCSNEPNPDPNSEGFMANWTSNEPYPHLNSEESMARVSLMEMSSLRGCSRLKSSTSATPPAGVLTV